MAEAITPAADVDADVEGQEPDPNDTKDTEGDGDGEKPDEQPKQYSEAYVKQLRREAASNRTKLSQTEKRLQEYEDADKTELEKLTERATAAEARAQEAELKVLRYDVVSEKGLDLQAAKFLTGSTREEVEAGADELTKLLGETGQKDGKGRLGGFDGGARTPAPDTTPKTPAEAHNDFLSTVLRKT